MRKLLPLTFAHFAVDLCCFTVLFAALRPALGLTAELSVGFLLYNLLAFGLQAPVGAFLDGRPGTRCPAASVGLLVTIIGLALAWAVKGAYGAYAGMVTAALGNAVFHAGAGSTVICESRGRLAPSGVFNCAGALGVGLGTLLGSSRPGFAFPFALLAAVAALALLPALTWRERSRDESPEMAGLVRDVPFFALLALLALAAFLHSLACAWVPEVPELTGWLTLAPAVMICLGKLLGGFISDRLGAGVTAVIGAVLAAALFLGSGGALWTVLPAALLLNMAVPAFLCAMAGAMPDSPGFAFGLVKLSLVLGTAVTYLLRPPASAVPIVLAALAALTAGLTAGAVRLRARRTGDTEKR